MQHAITDRCHWHQQKQKCCLHETFCFLCSARKTKRHQFLKTINNAPTMCKNITQKHNGLLNLPFITLMGKITSLLSMWTWSLPGESVDQPCVFSYDFACWSWDTQSKPPANYKNKQTKKKPFKYVLGRLDSEYTKLSLTVAQQTKCFSAPHANITSMTHMIKSCWKIR